MRRTLVRGKPPALPALLLSRSSSPSHLASIPESLLSPLPRPTAFRLTFHWTGEGSSSVLLRKMGHATPNRQHWGELSTQKKPRFGGVKG